MHNAGHGVMARGLPREQTVARARAVSGGPLSWSRRSCRRRRAQGPRFNVKTVKAALRKVLEQRGGGVRTL